MLGWKVYKAVGFQYLLSWNMALSHFCELHRFYFLLPTIFYCAHDLTVCNRWSHMCALLLKQPCSREETLNWGTGMYIFFEQRVLQPAPQKQTFCLTGQLCPGFCLSAEANKGWHGGHSQLVKDREGNKTEFQPAIRKFLSCLTFYVISYVFIRNNLDKS